MIATIATAETQTVVCLDERVRSFVPEALGGIYPDAAEVGTEVASLVWPTVEKESGH